MGQVEFLRGLFETGQVKVGPVDDAYSPGARSPADHSPAERSWGTHSELAGPEGPLPPGANLGGLAPAVLEVVREWDAANRLEFPGDAPPLDAVVALRAVERFYRACQFTVYRDVDAATVARLFAEPVARPPGERPTVADHYTVDLVFRFLPELYRLAHRMSKDDPLCHGLRQWAEAWPLSSIGMPEVNPTDLSAVWEDEGLVRLVADRVIARRDVSRLADPRVRAAVQTALGYYDDLSAPVAKALKSYAASGAAPPAVESRPTPL